MNSVLAPEDYEQEEKDHAYSLNQDIEGGNVLWSAL